LTKPWWTGFRPRHASRSALAHWLSKQRFGGKPVVIRRNILSSAESH
jgi:hypothetical protein